MPKIRMPKLKMPNLKEKFRKVKEKVWNPKVSQEELEEKIREIKQKLPIPVFWLLGKAQSGKTSIIRVLTGNTGAEIGNGFQPCTRYARLYEFPNKEDCFIRFLDTRGLGEVDYDPKEDMAIFSKQAHLLIVVVKAMDQVQENILTILRQVLKDHPSWRIIMAQTNLHEGYPGIDSYHLIPYPYSQSPLPHTVPKDLARSLLKQRELFKGIPAQFVPIDFTLAEDGYNPVDYGRDALWQAIETALPLGLQSMIQEGDYQTQLQDIFSKKAHPHIISYSILAGLAGLIPIPWALIPFVLGIQAKMFQTIASIYDQEINRGLFIKFFGGLGLSGAISGAAFIIRDTVKEIPGFNLISAVYNASITYALGKTLCVYFNYYHKGMIVDPQVLKKVYAEELIKGRQLLANYIKTFISKNNI